MNKRTFVLIGPTAEHISKLSVLLLILKYHATILRIHIHTALDTNS